MGRRRGPREEREGLVDFLEMSFVGVVATLELEGADGDERRVGGEALVFRIKDGREFGEFGFVSRGDAQGASSPCQRRAGKVQNESPFVEVRANTTK